MICDIFELFLLFLPFSTFLMQIGRNWTHFFRGFFGFYRIWPPTTTDDYFSFFPKVFVNDEDQNWYQNGMNISEKCNWYNRGSSYNACKWDVEKTLSMRKSHYARYIVPRLKFHGKTVLER